MLNVDARPELAGLPTAAPFFPGCEATDTKSFSTTNVRLAMTLAEHVERGKTKAETASRPDRDKT
jgi:hypothetical protein